MSDGQQSTKMSKETSSSLGGWLSLPQKDQLAVLFLSRFVDIFQNTLYQSFMVYQLRSFDRGISDGVIATQAGFLIGGFAASQATSALFWARVADISYVGRKGVLLCGLILNAMSCAGLALSTSFAVAMAWRVVAGLTNANLIMV
jgi:MFS family permease